MSRAKKGSLKRETISINARRLRLWRAILKYIITRRALEHNDNTTLLHAFKQYVTARRNKRSFMDRSILISTTTFNDVFKYMGDEQCLLNFRFLRRDLLKIVDVVVSGPDCDSTDRNNYSCTKLLRACVVLKRLSTPQRWTDLEVLFRKHSAQLSEIFWESLDSFIDEWQHLLTSPICHTYTSIRAPLLAEKVEEKVGALNNCIGFIDGTVLEIARPDDDALQNVCYNGHKRKHALKFQAVTTADGLFYHVYGPVEGRRHDWTLYMRSGLDEQMEDVLYIDGIQYCIYGDSGYNSRPYLEVPFQGSTLSGDQTAFNQAMSAARITVEWMFKEAKTFWTTVDFPRKMRVMQLPVGSLYLASLLLCNLRTCIYKNQTSLYFRCPPPTLNDYLHSRD